MKIIKEVLIHDKRWELEFLTFGDSRMNLRFIFNMRNLLDLKKNLCLFKHWGRYKVYYDYGDKPAIYDTLLEARIAIFNYLLYESF